MRFKKILSRSIPILSKLPNIDEAYLKVMLSIKSVKTKDQLESVKHLIRNFLRLYNPIGNDASYVFNEFIKIKEFELRNV